MSRHLELDNRSVDPDLDPNDPYTYPDHGCNSCAFCKHWFNGQCHKSAPPWVFTDSNDTCPKHETLPMCKICDKILRANDNIKEYGRHSAFYEELSCGLVLRHYGVTVHKSCDHDCWIRLSDKYDEQEEKRKLREEQAEKERKLEERKKHWFWKHFINNDTKT